MNFPCTYVVFWCFPFHFFFPIFSFSILKTESEHRAKGRNCLERKDGKQKAEVPGLLVLILLLCFYFILFSAELFDSFQPHLNTICSSAIEIRPLVPPKTALSLSGFFRIYYHFCLSVLFFCLFLCSFSGFRSATSFETVTAKEQEQKQVEFCLDWFSI